jgi:DNA-directed RNA polymerase subunit RPC12/RpoP
VHFVDVLIRQAHPGPDVPPYESFEQKWHDALRYQQEEGIPWTVLIDDLEGTTHQVYGGLADPTYLIDAQGYVAFYNMWTHVPTLHQAITALLGQGGLGVVRGGIDNYPHLLASVAEGWRGLRRGLPQSFIDLETAAPTLASGTWLGHRLRPLLAPLARRARPLPGPVRFTLACATALVVFAMQRLNRQRQAAATVNRHFQPFIGERRDDTESHQDKGDESMAEYRCNACGKLFNSPNELREHERTCKAAECP